MATRGQRKVTTRKTAEKVSRVPAKKGRKAPAKKAAPASPMAISLVTGKALDWEARKILAASLVLEGVLTHAQASKDFAVSRGSIWNEVCRMREAA